MSPFAKFGFAFVRTELVWRTHDPCGGRAAGNLGNKMKAILIIALIAAVKVTAGTVVAPNDKEAIEGDTSAIPLFGGDQGRTQIIYSAQHFSLFPPEGV